MAEINRLIDGYRRFHRKYFSSGNPLYEWLAHVGQAPKTLVIACSDSRVDPSIIMDAEPGDIFVVRNVANLVPPYESGETGHHGVSAALEFAVRILQVNHIVILGHSNCAGIQTLIGNGVQKTDFIGRWMSIAKPAKEMALAGNDEEPLAHRCEKAAIQLSLANLMTFPWIKQRYEAGELELHGWYFTLADGSVSQCHPGSAFEKI